MIVPAALIGTLLGVLLNRQTPGWGIVSLLVVILSAMTVMVAMRAWAQFREEQQHVAGSSASNVYPSATQASSASVDKLACAEGGLSRMDVGLMTWMLSFTILCGV